MFSSARFLPDSVFLYILTENATREAIALCALLRQLGGLKPIAPISVNKDSQRVARIASSCNRPSESVFERE